jgi:hypothetical protein
MSTFVLAHVNELGRAFDGRYGCIANGLGTAYKCNYSAVGSLSRVNIQ